MLNLLGNFAKGVAKKKVKKKGAEMANNITNKKEKDDSSAIVVREKSTTLSAPLLGGDTDSSDSSANTSKKSRSRSPLDRINSSLKDIMKTLKKRRKLMLNKSRRMRVQADKEKKDKREGLLESMKNTGKKMVKSAAAGAKGWWERLQRFLLMTLVGSLVVAIKENWEAIKVQIDKVVNVVKDIWEFTSPIIIPLFKALKWIAIQGFKMMAGIVTTDNKKIEKETDQLSQDLKALEKTKKDIDGKFKEAEQGVRDLKGKKFSDLADEAGLSDKISPDSPAKSDVTKEQVEEEVGTQITGSDIETKLDDFKTKVNEVNPKPVKVDTSKMKKYETGASPVPETGPAIVHKGEVIIPAPVVKQVGGSMKIENILNMMQSSSKENILNMMQTSATNIKQNPLKVISIMEGMSKQFAPMGEQLPSLINETIKESKLGTVSKKVTREMVEKMENTLTILKEQTDYEEQSGNTLIISAPKPSRPSVSGGGGGGTKVIPIGESGKTALNRYVNAVIQKTLY